MAIFHPVEKIAYLKEFREVLIFAVRKFGPMKSGSHENIDNQFVIHVFDNKILISHLLKTIKL